MEFDVIVIGGGATGLGVAVEAQSRGYKTLLVEAYDFGKGTSSKSTKLVHGGIRYLANLDIELVKEGLSERHFFLANAPHLAHAQAYLIPIYSMWEKLKYFSGVKLYDFLAGNKKIGQSKFLSYSDTIKLAPNINQQGLIGAIIYYDGQFDDTRMLITLLRTFQELGGVAYNYRKVISLVKDDIQNNAYNTPKIKGVKTISTLPNSADPHTLGEQTFYAKVIINATGTFTDSILDLDEPIIKHHHVTAAQGTHLVFKQDVFPCSAALVIPKTNDGRLLFVLPWHDNKIIVGTTDVVVDHAEIEPTATADEIDFILDTLNQYTTHQVSRADVYSVFSGQRPLVTPATQQKSGKISRKHEIFFSKSGIACIVGGKWTIYRLMGEDTINAILQRGLLPPSKSDTQHLALFGTTNYKHNGLNTKSNGKIEAYPLSIYGDEAEKIIAIQNMLNDFGKLHESLPYYNAEVIYHVRHEMAKTVEDVLARRTHAIILDAKAAINAAPKVAALMAQELHKPKAWEEAQINEFLQFAERYCINHATKI